MATKNIKALGNAQSIGWTDALLSRLAANSVGLGARLSITAPANASALSSTGYSLTGSNASSMVDLAGTWNTSGMPTLIKANVTDTASNVNSLLMDLQVGGTSKFNLTKASVLSGDPSNGLTVQFGTLVHRSGSNCGYTYSGGHRLSLGLNGYIAWGTTNDTFAATGLWLGADAANTLALRNSTAAQAFNIYNTYTSGSVYERGFMRWVSNVLEIGTEHVGASARSVRIKTATNTFYFNNGSLNTTPNLIISGASTKACGLITGTSGSSFIFDDTGYFSIAKDSNANLIGGSSNGGTELLRVTGTGLLTFGGVTNSFPALKRSSTVLQSRLADDSDFAPLQGQLRSHANATSETVTPTHTLRLFDAAGTEYRVPAIAV